MAENIVDQRTILFDTTSTRTDATRTQALEITKIPNEPGEVAAGNRPVHKYKIKLIMHTRHGIPPMAKFRLVAFIECNGAVATSTAPMVEKVTAFKVNSLGSYSYNGGAKKTIIDNTDYTNPDGTQTRLGTYQAILIKPKMSTLVL